MASSSASRSERVSLNRKVWNLPSIREKLKDCEGAIKKIMEIYMGLVQLDTA